MTTFRAAVAVAVLGVFQDPSVSFAASFPAVVEEILRSQTSGRIAELEEASKAAVITCVNMVLDGLPNGKKRFVTQGESFEERERRFGQVVQENHAEWKQKIAGACAKVVLSGSKQNTPEFGASRGH